MKRWLINVLIGLDEAANAVLGGAPQDTISFRAAVARRQGKRWGCWLCRVLDRFQQDHCGKTLAAEEANVEMRAREFEQGETPL